MNILVTGGAGYVGSMVVQQLLQVGHSVQVFDALHHGGDALLSFWSNPGFHFRRGDIRCATDVQAAVQGMDAVVHLAAIVGDPACARDPELARSTNLEGSLCLLECCQAAGVKRFVFASTCSNYGRMANPDQLVDEGSELRPVSLYAETKVQVEQLLLGQRTGVISPTVLRFSTAFGVSARMRFDLTVNEFAMEAIRKRKLVVFGEQFWRPYAHIVDLSRAVRQVLEAPEAEMRGEVFNVGAVSQNHRKLDLVKSVCDIVSGVEVEYVKRNEDPRDYRVAFDKIHKKLGFTCTRSVADGIREIAALVESDIITDFDAPRYRN